MNEEILPQINPDISGADNSAVNSVVDKNTEYASVAPGSFKFNENIIPSERTLGEDIYDTKMKIRAANPGMSYTDISAVMQQSTREKMRSEASPLDKEAYNSGLASREHEGFFSQFASDSRIMWHETLASLDETARALGVDTPINNFEHSGIASNLRQSKDGNKDTFERLADDPIGALGGLMGGGLTQIGMMVAPSIAISIFAPELGIAALGTRLMGAASTGKKVLDIGLATERAVRLGMGARVGSAVAGAAIKTAMQAPIMTTYMGMTLAPYADELYKMGGGRISYTEALGGAFIRSLGESIIETISVGGRITERVSKAFLKERESELITALTKKAASGLTDTGKKKIAQSIGERVLGRMTTPLFAGPSLAVNYVEGVMYEPFQEAVQEFYGQLVNSGITGDNKLDPKAWAESFVAMIPVSIVTGAFHASMETRKQIAEQSRVPLDANQMQLIKNQMSPENWKKFVDDPSRSFGDMIFAQANANKTKGSGAFHNTEPELIMSTLEMLKGMAVKMWVISNGQTSVANIYNKLVPILTNISREDAAEMFESFKAITAAKQESDPARREQALRAALDKYDETLKKSGLLDVIKNEAAELNNRETKRVNDILASEKKTDVKLATPTITLDEKGQKVVLNGPKTPVSSIQESMKEIASGLWGAIAKTDIEKIDSVMAELSSTDEQSKVLPKVYDAFYQTHITVLRALGYTMPISLEEYSKKLSLLDSIDFNSMTISLLGMASNGNVTEVTARYEALKQKTIEENTPKTADGVTPSPSMVVNSFDDILQPRRKERSARHTAPVFVTKDGSPHMQSIMQIAKVLIDYAQKNKVGSAVNALLFTNMDIINAVKNSGDQYLLSLMPTKQLHAKDYQNILDAAKSLAGIAETKDISDGKPISTSNPVVAGPDGRPITLRVGEEVTPVTPTEVDLAERLRTEQIQRRAELQQNWSVEKTENLFDSVMRKYLYEKLGDVISVLAKPGGSLTLEASGDIADTSTISVKSEDYVLGQIFDLFSNMTWGGGRGNKAMFDASIYMEAGERLGPFAAANQIADIMLTDIDSSFGETVERIKSAYKAWDDIQAQQYETVSIPDVERNAREEEQKAKEDELENQRLGKIDKPIMLESGLPMIDITTGKPMVEKAKDKVYTERKKYFLEYRAYKGHLPDNPFHLFMMKLSQTLWKYVRQLSAHTAGRLDRYISIDPRTTAMVHGQGDKETGISTAASIRNAGGQQNIVYTMENDLLNGIFETMPSVLIKLAMASDSEINSDNMLQVIVQNEGLLENILDAYRKRYYSRSGDGKTIHIEGAARVANAVREQVKDLDEIITDLATGETPIIKTTKIEGVEETIEDMASDENDVDMDAPEEEALASDEEGSTLTEKTEQMVGSSTSLSPLDVIDAKESSQQDVDGLKNEIETLVSHQVFWFQAIAYLVDKYKDSPKKEWGAKELRWLEDMQEYLSPHSQKKGILVLAKDILTDEQKRLQSVLGEEKRYSGAILNIIKLALEDIKNRQDNKRRENKVNSIFRKTLLFKKMNQAIVSGAGENGVISKKLDGLFSKEEVSEAAWKIATEYYFTAKDLGIEPRFRSKGETTGYIEGFYHPNFKVGGKEGDVNIIVLLENATPATLMHEFMHHLMAKNIMPQEYQQLLRHAYGDDEEAIADAITAYIGSNVTDEQMNNNPALIPVVKWARAVLITGGVSVRGYLTIEATKFFDSVVAESNVATKQQMLAAKNMVSALLNNNASKSTVPSKVPTDILIPGNGSPDQKNPTVKDQYVYEVEKMSDILPVTSISELIDLLTSPKLSGSRPMESAVSPISVRIRGGNVVAIYINGSILTSGEVGAIMRRLDAAGFDSKAVVYYDPAGMRITGDKIARASEATDAAIGNGHLAKVTDNPKIKELLDKEGVRVVSKVKFGTIVNHVRKELTKWTAPIFEPEDSGMLVGFSGGKIGWEGTNGGHRRTIDASSGKIVVVVDPTKLSTKQEKDLLKISKGKSISLYMIAPDGSVLSLEDYVKVVPSINVSLAKEAAGSPSARSIDDKNIPGVTGQFLGYVDSNGYVHMKEKARITDGHIELFGNVALNHNARFRYDRLTGKVNWLNNPSVFEKQMVGEHINKVLKVPMLSLDNIGIDDGLYFSQFKANESGSDAKVVFASLLPLHSRPSDMRNETTIWPYTKIDKKVALKDLINNKSSEEFKAMEDVDIVVNMNSPETGVSYDPDSKVITIGIDESTTAYAMSNMIEHGLRLVNWAMVTNDSSVNNKKFKGRYSTPEFNKMGLITTSDALLSSPSFSAFTTDEPLFRADDGKPMSMWDQSVKRIEKAKRIFFHFMEEGTHKKLTEKDRRDIMIMIARETFGDSYHPYMTDMKKIKRYQDAHRLVMAMANSLLVKAGVDIDDPLEFRIIDSMNIKSAQEVATYVKSAVNQVGRYKDVKDMSESDVGVNSWEYNKNKISRWSAGYASRVSSPHGIAKFLDHGNPDGVFTRMVRDLFMPGVQEAKRLESSFKERVMSKIMSKFESNPELLNDYKQVPWMLHKPWAVGETQTSHGRAFTGSELIGIYLSTDGCDTRKNEKGVYNSPATRKIMRATEKLTDDMLAEIKKIVELDDYISRFKDAIEEMFAEAWGPLNETYMNLHNGKRAPKILGKYFPLMWNFNDEEIRLTEGVFDFMNNDAFPGKKLDPDFVEHRKKTAIRQSMPAFDAFEVLKIYSGHVDNYVAKTANLNKIYKILTDPNVGKVVSGKFSNRSLIDSFVKVMEREMTLTGRIHNYNAFEAQVLAPMRVNISKAFLKANPITLTRQWTSVCPAMVEIPPKYFPILMARIMQGYWKTLAWGTKRALRIGESTRSGKSNTEIAWSGDPGLMEMFKEYPILKGRMIDHNMVKLHSGEVWTGFGTEELKLSERLKSWFARGPEALKVTDVGVTYAIYKTAREAQMERLIAKGFSQEDAKRKAVAFAGDVVRVSNDPSNYSELSLLQTDSGELVRGALSFTGFLFKQHQMVIEKVLYPAVLAYQNKDGGEFVKIMSGLGASARQARVILWAMIFPALALGAMARGRLQDDDDECIGDILVYNLSSIPFLGQMIATTKSGGSATIYNALWIDTANGLLSSLGNIGGGIAGNQRVNLYKNGKELATSIAALSGAPTYPLRSFSRLIEYVNGKNVGEREMDALGYVLWGKNPERDLHMEKLRVMRERNLRAKGVWDTDIVPAKDKR